MTVYGVDLFCGIGGFSHGMKMAGVRVVLAVDCCEETLNVHRKRHPSANHVNMLIGNSEEELLQLINSHLPDLSGEDRLHIHASPPCQNLSSANTLKTAKDLENGLSLSVWVVAFLAKYFTRPSTSWSVEQVRHTQLMNLVSKINSAFCEVITMSDYGICQSRKRLFITNAPMKLVKTSPPCLCTLVQVPSRAVYLAGANFDRGKLTNGRHFSTKSVTEKPILGYTLTRWPCKFIDKDFHIVTYFRPHDYLILQTLPKDYLDDVSSTQGRKLAMIANCVPPAMAKQIVEYLIRG